MSLQGSSEFVLIGRPAHFPGRWRAPIPFPADFELRGTRLAQPLYRQSQLPIFHLRVEHAPHGISLSRPQVQKALVVFPGNRILRSAQIESNSAIFEDNGPGSFAQKVLDSARKRVRRHGRHCLLLEKSCL